MISWNLVQRATAATAVLTMLSGTGNLEAGAADKPSAGKKGSPAGTVIDLTHELNDKVPTYLRSEKPQFRYEVLTDLKKNGFSSGALRIPEHYATHIDAACHFIAGAGTIESIDPNRLILPAVVIDVRRKHDESGQITGQRRHAFLRTATDQRWNRKPRENTCCREMSRLFLALPGLPTLFRWVGIEVIRQNNLSFRNTIS